MGRIGKTKNKARVEWCCARKAAQHLHLERASTSEVTREYVDHWAALDEITGIEDYENKANFIGRSNSLLTAEQTLTSARSISSALHNALQSPMGELMSIIVRLRRHGVNRIHRDCNGSIS